MDFYLRLASVLFHFLHPSRHTGHRSGQLRRHSPHIGITLFSNYKLVFYYSRINTPKEKFDAVIQSRT
jgi:hypothetical protein